MSKQDFLFKIIKKDKKSKARAGIVTTPHGNINTPCFVPVGTKATVKGLTPQDLREAGVQLLFGNTYHLHLRPGEDLIKDFGGLARFMSWNGPTITDSGGFQVFSLGKIVRLSHVSDESLGVLSKVIPPASARSIFSLRSAGELRAVGSPSSFATPPKGESRLVKITDDGVEFRSHIDGSKHMFTPEKSIAIQKKLGADLILAFDECAPHPSTEKYTKEAMVRTHNWLDRCIKEFEMPKPSKRTFLCGGGAVRHDIGIKQALYGIIQGGIYKNLREESAKFVSEKPVFGIAIGGVSVGESKQDMKNVLEWTMPFLPEDKPRHLLGIGEIDDIFTAIENGMDTFDCVIPTRFGRYGIVFVGPPEGNVKNKFRIDLNKTIFARNSGPIANDCLCYVCKIFTRAYIHHLFRAQELLAYRLASYHNMFFINNLVKKIREAILEGRFGEMRKEWTGL